MIKQLFLWILGFPLPIMILLTDVLHVTHWTIFIWPS
jgi:hypothetical protein